MNTNGKKGRIDKKKKKQKTNQNLS